VGVELETFVATENLGESTRRAFTAAQSRLVHKKPRTDDTA
jgi:hypothetical protein